MARGSPLSSIFHERGTKQARNASSDMWPYAHSQSALRIWFSTVSGMTARPYSVRITCRQLQDKFNDNEGGYPAKIASLSCVCTYDKPANPKSRQRPGTRSKIYKYFDGHNAVMWLHCYERPDGTLGGSGKMDPKRLLVNGVEYYCD